MPICHLCKDPIQENRGTYWVKGTGGMHSRGVDHKSVVYAHWGRCARVVGKYFAQFPPDEKEEFWFWGRMPFTFQSDSEVTYSDKFIYILKSQDNYKIGITKDIKKRIGDLQTGNPVKILFVCSTFSENAYDFESELHNHFDEFRLQGEWFQLPPDKLEELIEILTKRDFVELKPPLDNVVYYARGTRVLWHSQPGTIHSLVIRPYEYEIGYNVVLDSQSDKNEPEVTNSGYDELVLEETQTPSLDGYRVNPQN